MIRSIKESLGFRKPSILNVKYRKFAKKRCLYFKFKGILNEESIELAIAKSKEFPMPKLNKKRILVFDCSSITDYDTKVRTLVQKTLKKSEGKVDTLWIISDSITILALAEILSFFTSIHIMAVRSADQLERKMYRRSA
ncbi:MAG: hypothetical protein HKN90_00075 [Flavobacteriaceae bacterium]|nr:hypothetical protein [Flavobacteriaceae bacterium]